MVNYIKYIINSSNAILKLKDIDEDKKDDSSASGYKLCDIYNKSAKEKIIKVGGTIAEKYWEEEPLTRKKVRILFGEDVYKGFVAAMLWGGLGVRSFNHLKNALDESKIDEVKEKLNRVKDSISKGNIKDAFLSMCPNGKNKIEGVGISYFTKILFFLGDDNSTEKIPLIYDRWGWHIHAAILLSKGEKDKVFDYFKLQAFLKKNKGNTIINPAVVLSSLTKKRCEAYMDYIEVMRDVSQEEISKSISPGYLEQYLFGHSLRDKAPDNPRVNLINYLTEQFTKLIKDAEIKVTEEGIEEDEVDDEDGIYPLGEEAFNRSNSYPLEGYRFHNGKDDLYLYVGKYNKKNGVFCSVFQKTMSDDLINKLSFLTEKGFEYKAGYYICEFKAEVFQEAKALMESLTEPIARAIWGEEAEKYLHADNS